MKTEKEKTPIEELLSLLFVGKRYKTFITIGEQARYLTLNGILAIAMIPLVFLGMTVLDSNPLRAAADFGLAGLCFLSLILLHTRVPLKVIPIFPVIVCGAYFCFLLYDGSFTLWGGVWLFTFPLITIFLCQMRIGVIESLIVLIVIILFLFGPLAPGTVLLEIRLRIVIAYIFIMGLTIIYEWISILKDRKEAALKNELAEERDIIQTMQDNIHHGIFLMDRDLKILSGYSKPLISILSYYDSDLEGKSFLDMLNASLEARHLNTMKGYFSMVFNKSKSAKVLEAANPISEFEYRAGDRKKTLATRFSLIERASAEPVVIGIIEDISREKEFEKELQTQKEVQELEMKNMFDVLQIDPLVFQDFVDDTESNFNYINAILKDRSLTEKQVLTKFYQNVHAMKSNALILGLETFGKKLHSLEDEIKEISAGEKVSVEDVLGLAIKLESIMQEKDAYLKIIQKIEAFKTSNQVDTVLIHSMTKAVEKIAAETQKKVELKAGQVDIRILESKLRKPIKDILFQCIRNSIYHGIEPIDERIQKNKTPASLLVFSLKNIDGNAELTFSDDGRGLDWEKIKKKYLALHPEAKNVTKKILLSSIFSPEFSTAEETNMIAGRGVGLSFVRDLVKENNGTIKVDSSDSGLTFKFTFPLTN